MSTKADETFQESVQALADWITFLEGKKGVYQRQLERASAAQAPEDDNTELDPSVDAVAVIETADPEMASWDEGDQELDSWDQVESDDAEEAAVQPDDDEEMAAWDVDLDGDLDTWGDEPEASEEPKDRKEPEEPKVSDVPPVQSDGAIDAIGPKVHLSEHDQELLGHDANLPSGQGAESESDQPAKGAEVAKVDRERNETFQTASETSLPSEQNAPGDGFPMDRNELKPGGQAAHAESDQLGGAGEDEIFPPASDASLPSEQSAPGDAVQTGIDDAPAWM
jgi:hypothetical protein